MNISEAQAAATVVDWIGSLRLWETTGGVTDEQLNAAVRLLAVKGRKALDAGRTEAEVSDLLDRLQSKGAYAGLLVDVDP